MSMLPCLVIAADLAERLGSFGLAVRALERAMAPSRRLREEDLRANACTSALFASAFAPC